MLANGKQICFSAKQKSVATSELAEEFPSIEKFNWLINLLYVRRDIPACKELIKKEIKRSNGKNEFAYFKQGEILREEQKLQEALDSFQTCLKLNPECSANFKEVAKCLYEMKRYKLCMEAYLQAESLAKNPDWQIYYYLGHCLMKLADFSKAKEYAQKAVKIGKHETCYSLLIKILIAEGDIKSAIAASNAALETCPDSVDLLKEAGLLNLKLGQSQQAFERLSSALALDPNNSKVLLGIGYITQKHEEYDVALTKYKIAVHHEPESVALWNNIGMCFYSKQKYVAAISCLKRALWMQPLNWQTLYNLGLAYLATSQPASAFNFACAAVNVRSDVADCYALMGAALVRLNDADNAASALRKAVSLAPQDAILAANAALCLYKCGSYEEAAEMLRKFEICVERGAEGTEELLEVMELADRLSSKLEEGRKEDRESISRERTEVSNTQVEKSVPIVESGERRELLEDEV